MGERHILNEKIKELGREQKLGKLNWQQIAIIINQEFGTNFTGDAIRKRYDRNKQTLNVSDNQTTVDIEDIIELTPAEKLNKETIMQKVVSDYENWELVSYKIINWMQHTREQVTKQLYAVKVTLKPKKFEVDPIKLLQSAKEVIKNIKPYNLEIVPNNIEVDINKLLELPGIELHLGKLAWESETGQNYDHHIAKERFKYIVQEVINFQNYEKCGTAVVYIGQDFFNSEANGMTTKGTPQQNDLRYTKMFDIGVELYVQLFLELRKHFKKVDVKLVQGNHDSQMSFFLYRLLQQTFKEDKIVKFDNNIKETQVYVFGKVAIFSNHGDFTSLKDMEKMLKSLISEFYIEIGKTWIRELHLGHLHSEHVVDDATGIIIRRVGSPTAIDKWHYQNRYIGAVQKYQIFTWHKQLGLTNTHYINFVKELDKKKLQKVIR